MNKVLVFVFVLFCCFQSHAQLNRWSVQPEIGYSSQNFNWSIAGNEQGTNPNVYSELIWENLAGMTYGLNIRFQLNNNIDLTLLNRYNKIDKGTGNDSDYIGNNRTDNFYDLDFLSNVGYNHDLLLNGRYRFRSFGILRPHITFGFSHISSKLHLLDVLNNVEEDLNSTYLAKWTGGVFGVGFELNHKSYYANLGYSISAYDYQAKANWNLRDDFQRPVSYRHLALGWIHEGKIQIGYQITDAWNVELTGIKHHGFTNPGLDKVYKSDGEIQRTRFNGAEFDRITALIGIGYKF